MKKIISLFVIVLLSSCTVIRSPYLPQQIYWGGLVAQTSAEAARQATLAYEANKNGLKDSAAFYSLNAVSLGLLAKQYTDSLLYYLNKK